MTRSRQHRPRAERFPLHVPARVRPVGHATWRDADVVNVSHTGVLVSVAATFPPAATIDVEFGVLDGAAGVSEVRCVAHVVREGRAEDGRALLAAAIERYEVGAGPTGRNPGRVPNGASGSAA